MASVSAEGSKVGKLFYRREQRKLDIAISQSRRDTARVSLLQEPFRTRNQILHPLLSDGQLTVEHPPHVRYPTVYISPELVASLAIEMLIVLLNA